MGAECIEQVFVPLEAALVIPAEALLPLYILDDLLIAPREGGVVHRFFAAHISLYGDALLPVLPGEGCGDLPHVEAVRAGLRQDRRAGVNRAALFPLLRLVMHEHVTERVLERRLPLDKVNALPEAEMLQRQKSASLRSVLFQTEDTGGAALQTDVDVVAEAVFHTVARFLPEADVLGVQGKRCADALGTGVRPVDRQILPRRLDGHAVGVLCQLRHGDVRVPGKAVGHIEAVEFVVSGKIGDIPLRNMVGGFSGGIQT